MLDNSKVLSVSGPGEFVLSPLSGQALDSVGLHESEIEEDQETGWSKDFSFYIL